LGGKNGDHVAVWRSKTKVIILKEVLQLEGSPKKRLSTNGLETRTSGRSPWGNKGRVEGNPLTVEGKKNKK